MSLQVVTSSGSIRGLGTPGYGTGLPAAPADSQEYILVDSVSAPTYAWRFRYNTGSSNADKWEFVGGSVLSLAIADPNAVMNTQTQVAATGSYYPTAGVNSFTAPRAGVYDFVWNGIIDPAGAAIGQGIVSLFSGSNTSVLGAYVVCSATAGQLSTAASAVRMFGVSAAAVIHIGWNHATIGTAKMRGGNLIVTPIRVS